MNRGPAPDDRDFSIPTEQMPERLDGVPDWWIERGNRLLATRDLDLPPIKYPRGREPPTNSLVRLGPGSPLLKSLQMWGDGNRVELGLGTVVEQGDLLCGDGSAIVIGDDTLVGETAWIDARNGGSIRVGRDGLWSSGVRVATDDMHAIIDRASGHRINRRGGRIDIGRHVWLGIGAIVLPGAVIGEDCVVGARSIVSGKQPAASVLVGVPARPVRSGVTWSRDDLPNTEGATFESSPRRRSGPLALLKSLLPNRSAADD